MWLCFALDDFKGFFYLLFVKSKKWINKFVKAYKNKQEKKILD